MCHFIFSQCDDGLADLCMQYDMGWQKRGSGRNYNSLSGVGTMIGHYSGKIVGCELRSKRCNICSFYLKQNREPPEHDCAKNWDGTSKGMEADVGANIVKSIETAHKEQCIVGTITDEDATTIARIRSLIQHEVEKWSDLSHVKKCCSNALWKLNKKYPRQLSAENINYFVRCFGYGIRQNKNNVDKITQAINNIVPHVYGQHEGCGDWCGFVRNPEKYKHKTLEGDFNHPELRCSLVDIFTLFANNSHKLAACASTHMNENFNHIVASKAPKTRHYSSSKSLEARVLCSVNQKNDGYDYLCNLHEKVGLSPGKVTNMQAVRTAHKRKRTREIKGSISYKRRRLMAKVKTKKSNQTAAVKEGVTYQSGVDLQVNVDVEEIPSVQFPPSKTAIAYDVSIEYSKVFFDLETTSLSNHCDVTQIAAVCQNSRFDQYVTPGQEISQGASEVTGLTFQLGTLFHHNRPVESIHIKSALQSFLAWLSNLPSPVVLIGHNCERFDSKVLSRKLTKYQLDKEFSDTVDGFVDTLPFFKQIYPELTKYTQEHLAHELLQATYEAHNAMADVTTLKSLVTHAGSTHLLEHSFTTSFIFDRIMFGQQVAARSSSFDEMVKCKVVSSAMAKKMASSGLCLEHLKLAYKRGGKTGIELLFKERNPNGTGRGQARVTSVSRIITNVSEFVHKLGINGTQKA